MTIDLTDLCPIHEIPKTVPHEIKLEGSVKWTVMLCQKCVEKSQSEQPRESGE